MSQLSSKQVLQSTTGQYAPPGFVCPAIAPVDRHKPSIRLAQNKVILFIGLNLHAESSAKTLIHLAELSYGAREHDKLAQIGEALSEHHRFEAIGAYYIGLAAMRSGRGNLSRAQRLLERAADSANATFKAKALLSLGALAWYQGEFNTEASLYRDALSVQGASYSTRIELNRAVAFNLTAAGDYQKAIDLLQSIAPMVKAVARHNPRLYFDYLNNYAVNLQAVGRLQDALKLAAIICASPLATVYHEWRETKEEVERQIAEQESRAIIIATPKREGKPEQARAYERIAHIAASLRIVRSEPPTICVSFADTIITIQSRLRYSFTPHAPPFLSGK